MRPLRVYQIGIAVAAAACSSVVAQPDDSSGELAHIVLLQGGTQRNALKKLVADSFGTDEKFPKHVFYYESELRPVLLDLLNDGDADVDAGSRWLLSLIGNPDDLRRMLASPPATPKAGFEERWRYHVACSLLDPSSDEEWAFLRKAGLNEYDDRWVDAGAIQTLKLIASPRSREILEEVRTGNPSRSRFAERAVAYIDSKPAPLYGENLGELAKRVAAAVKIGDWEGNRVPIYNKSGDKALVDIGYQTEVDALTYTATFYRDRTRWKLRGVRETAQAFAPAPRRKTK